MMNFIKKIFAATLIIAIVTTTAFSSVTAHKAEAQWATFDAANIVQTTISAISTAASSLYDYALQYKELVLDGVAYSIAKSLLHSMTSSVVQWINSGFEGSPSFITDPAAFTMSATDQLVGLYLSKHGALQYLCSPFSIDVRIALALKYRPNNQKYTCTLSTVIKNVTAAGKNASINGFTAGDFKQGGWPAFVSLTTEPQNNVYGAYVKADYDLGWQVANKSAQQHDELNQGKGFLSYKVCDQYAAGGSTSVGRQTVTDTETGQTSTLVSGGGNTDSENLDTNGNVKTVKQTTTVTDTESGATSEIIDGGGNTDSEDLATVGSDSTNGTTSGKPQCLHQSIQTPGSVISGMLETQLGSPVRELELADEFNEIINALFSQLVTKVLTGGLKGASGTGPSDKNSYLTQLQNEQAGNPEQIKSLRTELTNSINAYLPNTKKYKDNADTALNIALDARKAYDAARTCYVEKQTLYPIRSAYYQQKIDSVDSVISTKITPVASSLLSNATAADERLQVWELLKVQTDTAKTLQDINVPVQKLRGIIQNKDLIGGPELASSEALITSTHSKMDSLKQDATRQLQACQIYGGADEIH